MYFTLDHNNFFNSQPSPTMSIHVDEEEAPANNQHKDAALSVLGGINNVPIAHSPSASGHAVLGQPKQNTTPLVAGKAVILGLCGVCHHNVPKYKCSRCELP